MSEPSPTSSTSPASPTPETSGTPETAETTNLPAHPEEVNVAAPNGTHPATGENRADTGESQSETDAELRQKMAHVIQEYLRLDQQLRTVENTNFRVCIFGSARIRRRDPTWQMVYMLAKKLARMGIDIVTGGGPGLMEAANRAVQDAHDERSKAYGLPLDIPTLREPANKHLDIKSAHQRFSTRLDEFMRLSHAVVVAPGGIGTMLELMYVWQLIQIGLIEPRPVLLLGVPFWNGLLDWMRETMAERGFIDWNDLDFVHLVSTREEAVEILAREQEKFLHQLETTRAGHTAPPVTVTVGQPAPLGPGAPVPTAAGLVMTAEPENGNGGTNHESDTDTADIDDD